MQLLLLTASPSIYKLASLLFCGCVLGRMHYNMQTQGSAVIFKEFFPVLLSCATIQIMFRLVDVTDFKGMMNMVQMFMSH